MEAGCELPAPPPRPVRHAHGPRCTFRIPAIKRASPAGNAVVPIRCVSTLRWGLAGRRERLGDATNLKTMRTLPENSPRCRPCGCCTKLSSSMGPASKKSSVNTTRLCKHRRRRHSRVLTF
ncbi:unnamed protein product [Pedinophyceae sp. YPF-701]|nr:unnamed protein product [Pedinophyceae sp. YPF-701]